MTRAWFLGYVQQVLAPTLRPSDIVVRDNLPAHETLAARQAVEATGARLMFLPPYFARLQSDRERLLQAQGAPAQSRRTHDRPALASGRNSHRRLHAGRMR